MATKDAAQAAQTEIEEEKPVEQTENQELFGKISDDDKANTGFTDEELAEMKDGESEEAEPAGEEAEDGEEAEAGEQPAEGEADAGEESQGEEVAAAAEEQPAADDDSEFDDHPLIETRGVLPSEWALPQGAREQVGQLEQKAAELATAFDNGNMSAADFRTQTANIDAQKNALISDIRDAERSFSKAQQHWEQRTVTKFLRDNPEWKANPVLINMLDAEVRRLQAASQDPFDPRIMLKAGKNLKVAMGQPVAKQEAGETETKQAAKPAKQPGRIPPGKAPEVPPTLARIPNDEINDVEGGKYARLDRLAGNDPLAYQDALNRMSDAEREAYLAA